MLGKKKKAFSYAAEYRLLLFATVFWMYVQLIQWIQQFLGLDRLITSAAVKKWKLHISSFTTTCFGEKKKPKPKPNQMKKQL